MSKKGRNEDVIKKIIKINKEKQPGTCAVFVNLTCGELMKYYPLTTARKKGTLGRPRRRWVGNIKIDLREIGWVGMDWIDLAQDRDH
jgi:hypothetical protein